MSNDLSFSAIFERSLKNFKESIPSLLVFLFFYLVLDLTNFFLQTQVFYSEQESRIVEICYQLCLVLFTVIYYHSLNLKKMELQHSVSKILLEGVFLSPGFILQTLFFVLTVMIGGLLLVLPGLYAFLVFYFSPVVSVLYPDYEGKIFLHTRELVSNHLPTTGLMILFTGLVPFIPDGLIFLLTGNMKNILMAAISPLDGVTYLFCQMMIFEFVFSLVSYDRKRSS